MKDDKSQITPEDIGRMAREVGTPLPEGYADKIMKMVDDSIEEKKKEEMESPHMSPPEKDLGKDEMDD